VFAIWCNATALSIGGEAKGSYYISGNGQLPPGDVVILGYSLILVLLLMFITVFIVKAIGNIVERNFDIVDLAYAWGLYFGLLGINQLTEIYLGSQIVMDWINLFVTILGVPMVLVPVIAFFLSFFDVRGFEIKKAKMEKRIKNWTGKEVRIPMTRILTTVATNPIEIEENKIIRLSKKKVRRVKKCVV
jgi:hypothetical protein